MQLKKFTVGLKSINFTAVVNPKSDQAADETSVAEEERKVTAQEEPLPELTEAIANLAGPFIEIMALPDSYREGLSVYGFSITRTKNGTRAVQLLSKKSLNTIGGNLHPMEAPYAKIDSPGDGESGEQQVSNDARDKIEKAIYEAERYVQGERSQQLLGFETAKAALKAQTASTDEETGTLI